jgi:hypothetical protein
MGWDVKARTAGANSASTSLYSVLCNSFGNVLPDRRTCDAGAAPVGEAHVRYDCTDKTFWILTYVYSNFYFNTVRATLSDARLERSNRPASNTIPCVCTTTLLLLLQVPGNSWAVNECPSLNNKGDMVACSGAANKFIQYTGDGTSANCIATCTADATTRCCQDM